MDQETQSSVLAAMMAASTAEQVVAAIMAAGEPFAFEVGRQLVNANPAKLSGPNPFEPRTDCYRLQVSGTLLTDRVQRIKNLRVWAANHKHSLPAIITIEVATTRAGMEIGRQLEVGTLAWAAYTDDTATQTLKLNVDGAQLRNEMLALNNAGYAVTTTLLSGTPPQPQPLALQEAVAMVARA